MSDNQKDYVKQCQKAAKSGDVVAQNTLGFLYLNGQSVKQDNTEAVKWFSLSAHKGYAAAQYNLAVILKLGSRL